MKLLPVVLLYNNGTCIPFQFSSALCSGGWKVSLDKGLMEKAAVVVFHLPSLDEFLSSELEKTEGQLWIGWRQTNEPDIREVAMSVWEYLFDFYLSYSPAGYWKCATTFGVEAQSVGNTYRILDSMVALWRKVDFMLIGTQKGGSTALHEYLNQHSSCWGSLFKEPGFFLYPCVYTRGLSWYMGRMWREQPPLRYSLSRCLLFESSTWYSFWYEVPQRLFEYNPELKLIFLVRNPVERAFSQYNMLVHWDMEHLLYEYSLYADKEKLERMMEQLLNVEKYPFSHWVDMEMKRIEMGDDNSSDFFPDFLRRGIYYEQLKRYYRFFSPENILIVESGELKYNRIHTLQRIERFLDIPAVDWGNMDLEEKFSSYYESVMPEELHKKLASFFIPYNEKLYRLIDKNYNWK